LVVHSPSHGMNTCEPSEKPHFIDVFYDSFSSGVGHGRGHASRDACVGSTLMPFEVRCLFAKY